MSEIISDIKTAPPYEAKSLWQRYVRFATAEESKFETRRKNENTILREIVADIHKRAVNARSEIRPEEIQRLASAMTEGFSPPFPSLVRSTAEIKIASHLQKQGITITNPSVRTRVALEVDRILDAPERLFQEQRKNTLRVIGKASPTAEAFADLMLPSEFFPNDRNVLRSIAPLSGDGKVLRSFYILSGPTRMPGWKREIRTLKLSNIPPCRVLLHQLQSLIDDTWDFVRQAEQKGFSGKSLNNLKTRLSEFGPSMENGQRLTAVVAGLTRLSGSVNVSNIVSNRDFTPARLATEKQLLEQWKALQTKLRLWMPDESYSMFLGGLALKHMRTTGTEPTGTLFVELLRGAYYHLKGLDKRNAYLKHRTAKR